MSERKPTWVDYANLGANIVQVGQLSRLSGMFGKLMEIEVAREKRTQLENELRQFIFEVEHGVKALVEYIEIAPLGLYFTVSTLDRLLDDIGIQPATFQHFVDKDRARHLREAVRALAQEAKQELDSQDVDNANFHIKIVPRLGDLEELIAHQQASEELEKTQEKWERLTNLVGSRRRKWNLPLYGGLISFLCLGPVLSTEHPEVATSLMVLGFLLVFAAALGFFAAKPEGYSELKASRSKSQDKLLSQRRFKELSEFFGKGLSAAEYQAILDLTLSFADSVTKEDRYGKSLPTPLFELVLPTRLFEQGEPDGSQEPVKVVVEGGKWKCPNCGGLNPESRMSCLGCRTERL